MLLPHLWLNAAFSVGKDSDTPVLDDFQKLFVFMTQGFRFLSIIAKQRWVSLRLKMFEKCLHTRMTQPAATTAVYNTLDTVGCALDTPLAEAIAHPTQFIVRIFLSSLPESWAG